MHRALLALAATIAASAAIASASWSHSDALFHLNGWAEIPSTYRHPGPVSGQFTTGPVNGVTPPYQGQPIPASRDHSVHEARQLLWSPGQRLRRAGNSADFVLGFYSFTPPSRPTVMAPRRADRWWCILHTVQRLAVGCLDLESYITDGPV